MEHIRTLSHLVSAMVVKCPVETTSLEDLTEIIQQSYIDHYFDFVRRHQWDIGGTFRSIFRQNEEEAYHSHVEKMKENEDKLLNDPDHDVIRSKLVSTYFLEPGYYGWGFSPKLAMQYESKQQSSGKDLKIRLNYNCFANAVFIGSVCCKRGLVTRLGMTPDHPYIIVDLGDGTYMYDVSGPKKMHGIFEERNGYSIYRPDRKDHMVHKLLLVHDFKRGMIHEILENVEALRRILASKDANIQLLPGQLGQSLQLAEEYRSVITKTVWPDLQFQLFPEISRSFYENKDEWQKEMVTMSSQRDRQYPMIIVKEALTIALLGRSSLHIWGPSISLVPAIKKFKKKTRKHFCAIKRHLLHGDSVPRGVSYGVRKQIFALRQHIEHSAEKDTMPKILREARAVLHSKKLSPFQQYKKKKHDKASRKNY